MHRDAVELLHQIGKGVFTVKKILMAAAALTLSTAGNAAVNLITNGSFENASVNPGGGFTSLAGPSNAITGWKVGGAGVDYIGGYWQAQDGVRSIDLSGSTLKQGSYAGSVSQSFATVTGHLYQVDFWMAGNPDGGPSLKTVLTSATDNGVNGISQLYANDFTVTGANTRANMGWEKKTFRFVATGDPTTLNFQSAVNTAFGAALDNVSVTAVPEPAVWGMMIAGFGVVGFSSRRRRSIKAVTA